MQSEQATQQDNTVEELTDVTVRDVPKATWQQARAAALLLNQPIGRWLGDAIRQRLQSKGNQ